MAQEYTCADFEGLSGPTQNVLVSIGNFIRTFASSVVHYEYYVAWIGAIVNVLHLYILSRKSIRCNSINIFLMGTGICDMFCLCLFIHAYTLTLIFPDDRW